MKALVDEGYVVTAGVLNLLDSDYDTCELLKIPAVTEAPFSPITDKAHAANIEMIKNASIVVITSVPFGLGNLRNLEAAREALKQGIPTYFIDEVPIESRDFTDGKATQLMLELKAAGAIFVKQQSDLPSLLNISKEKTQLPQKTQTAAGHLKTPEEKPFKCKPAKQKKS
jgi:iron complex transport system ATP-binding protein